MRIAIDARMIKPGTMHGIARYVYQLLLNLKNQGKEHTFVVLVNRGSPLLALNWPSHMQLKLINSEWISIREHFEIPRVLKSLNIDLFHAPSYIAPFFTRCKLVMTIHDLIHMVLPQFYTPLHQLYYRLIVRRCTQRSECVLTVSNFSKQEIVRELGIPPERVHVTYNGVSEYYQKVKDAEFLEYVRDLYELPEKFIFCLSNNKPHKNVLQLIRAYCHANLNIPLVLACPVDRNAIRIAENYGKKHLIYFAKFISEEHLPAVYSMTHLFVYPSTYEGFGLPPLEALACGAPVVVAKSSSLPEVVGENAIFVDPLDHIAIADALVKGVSDQGRREELSKQGIHHAKQFSWSKMTAETLAIYERYLYSNNRVVSIDKSQQPLASPSTNEGGT